MIYPDLRGMSLWNTFGLLAAIKAIPPLLEDPNAALFVGRIVSRLYELARNDGKTPQDRAINWAATQFIIELNSLLGNNLFRKMLGENAAEQTSALANTAVHDVQRRPSSCQESGGEYDVDLSLFDVENIYRGLTVIASKVDVSDVVPVTLALPRVFNRRN